jgi:hypothetical protein
MAVIRALCRVLDAIERLLADCDGLAGPRRNMIIVRDVAR